MSGRRTRKHAAAEPPVNVQLLYVDGDIVPVDCRYIGWDVTERLHVWEVIDPRPHIAARAILVEQLPVATSITLPSSLIGLCPDDRLPDE